MIPCRLSVVMGVHIDPARRHQRPVSGDLPSTRQVDISHLDDPVADDCDVSSAFASTGAVHDGAAADHQIRPRSRHGVTRPWAAMR